MILSPLDTLPPVLSYSSHEFLGPVRPVKIHETKGATCVHGSVGKDDLTITLTKVANEDCHIVLDYGHDVSGVPIIVVESFSPAKGADMLITYSEGLPAVYYENGDGPFPFTSGCNTLRAVPYSVDFVGPIEDLYLQGGQRWQMIRLTKPGSVTLRGVGFRPTAFHAPIENLAGYFRCSDELLNEIWSCGAWTGQINQIPSRVNTQSFLPSPLGTIVDSQRPSQYYHGRDLSDYKLECSFQIHRGGCIFSVRNSTGFGLQIQILVDEVSNRSTVRSFWGMYDETNITLYNVILDTKEGPPLTLEDWHNIVITVQGDSFVEVAINSSFQTKLSQGKGMHVMPDGLDRDITTTSGSFGFGCGKHQLAIFKRLSVHEIPSGKLIYSNSLTSNSVLTDFAVGTNAVNSAYDGAKRDRAIWLGDTITQAQVLFYTTRQTEFMEASIDAVLSRQNKDGIFPIYTFPGMSFYNTDAEKEPAMIYEWLIGSFMSYIVRVVWEFYWHTGDLIALKRWYPRISRVLDALEKYKDDRGVLVFPGAKGGDSDYYNPARSGASVKQNGLYIIALDRASRMAKALGEPDHHTSKIQPISTACDKLFWNAEQGFYDIAESMRGELSEDGNSFAILSGICPAHRAKEILVRMRKLYTPGGASSFPIGSKAMHSTAVVSPIMNSWHAQAAIDHGMEDDARELYRLCYGPMVDKENPWYSGAFWEFSTPQGTPFLDHFCSLAHPFGAQPVYHIGSYILGVQPTSAGFATYIIEPRLALAKDLSFAQGRIPTPFGQVEVSWRKQGKVLNLTVTTPASGKGTLSLVDENGQRVEIVSGQTSVQLDVSTKRDFVIDLP